MWENKNDALTEKQVKIRLYRDGISTGQEFLLNEENGWEYTVDKVPLFLDKKPVEYKIEEVEIGKTHYSPEFGDGFLYYEVIYPEIQYKDSTGQLLSPKNENEFQNISKIELEVQNLHFNLAERSFLKTDDLPRNRLAGAEFMFYEVSYKEGTSEYVDDTGYTVEYDEDSKNGEVVLKKDGKKCQPVNDRGYKTDEKGMLQLPKEMKKGRYWMVESTTPNKGETGKTQYQDNMALYMVDVEDEILFLYEKNPQTNIWKPLADRHVVNHPHKGGVTVKISKEVTGPFGEHDKPFAMEILYWEDGMTMSKTVTASLKDGDAITLQHVEIGSELEIREAVDTLKYDISISQKNQDGSYLVETPALENKDQNIAVMTCEITGMPGDVVELKVTNKNTEDATPDTGIHLDKNLYVWMLILISITAVLFFWRRKKNRIERE